MKLRESHACFEALFDASPVGMYLVDAELRIRQVSRKARPVFGDMGELIGIDLVEVIHILWPAKMADEIVARFRHTLKTGEPYAAAEFSEERQDRKVREYYDWQIHRISLLDGGYGVVCYFTDISARMKLSNELRQMPPTCPRPTAARTSSWRCWPTNSAIRSPPIRNALQILRLTDGDGEAVRSASEMMDRQVARWSAGGRPARREPHQSGQDRTSQGADRTGIGREPCRRSEPPGAGEHGHELTVTLPPQPIYLHADPIRLAQVVGNLLNNACKFTDKGGRIWLTVEQEGEQAVIRVRDTGIGIAADQLPRIFDMFTQVDTSLERSAADWALA